MLRHQRTSAMATAIAAALSVSFRIIAKSLWTAHSRASGNSAWPLDRKSWVPAFAGTSGNCRSLKSAFLDAILFVAAAAIVFADVAEGGLEAVEVGDFGGGALGVGAELGESCCEVVNVLPDLRIGRGFPAGLRVIREQRRLLGG